MTWRCSIGDEAVPANFGGRRVGPASSGGRLAELERRLAAVERAVRSIRQETEHVKLDRTIQVISGRRCGLPWTTRCCHDSVA
jgi:hypothetical protein